MQFSLVIGLYLSAMGVGAWLSRALERDLALRFLEIELTVALVGGASAPALFLLFPMVKSFVLVLLAFVFVIGTLVGLELPLLLRLLKEDVAFKDLVSRVLTFDYVGALFAALLFPLLLVPELGLMRTSLLAGLCNAGVGLWGTWLLRPVLGRHVRRVRLRAGFVMLLLLVGLTQAGRLTSLAEDQLYADPIVTARTTPYQRIVVTSGRSGFNLFLNGNLQFSSADEYRYHEALVGPAMAAAERPVRRVMILGGGDGLAMREVLAHPGVERVTLVDLDPEMTALGRNFPPLAELNRHAFDDPRVKVVNQDAMIFVAETRERWDAVIVDFPDPNSFALGKLYTTLFYRRLAARLEPGAVVALQSTSPLFARKSFWCVIETLRAASFVVHPYQVPVPSFGVWGFALARMEAFVPPSRVVPGVPRRFLDDDALAQMFRMPADTKPIDVEVNRLDNQVLVHYYEDEWRRFE